MAKVFVATLLVTILADQRALAAYCRFASTSASQEKCVFPCRCTDGCDTTSGDCLNGGRCEDGPPSGYRWSGPGCQTGNIAYRKNASESIGPVKWAIRYPAGNALDGNTNTRITENSCAHPDITKGQNAWWMVDFGKIYNLSRVIIYNRKSSHERLDTFILSVGNSPDRTTHTPCARYYGRVAGGTTVDVICRGVTRYLSFRRDGGHEPHLTGLCEVVVIGHEHVFCQFCPSRCDDVIGCDACDPGKQQPDCKRKCEHGTYGKNCEEDCGQCRDTQQCDVKIGHCLTGCNTWYTSSMCKRHISAPYFATSDKPDIEDISSSSAVVTWPKARGVATDLESHYYYIVWIQANGETSWKSQTVGMEWLLSSITDLLFNTNYLVKIEPFRRHNDNHEGGTITEVIIFKTKCIAPDIPIIEKVKPSAKNESIGASILVVWKKFAHSGCDALVTVRVEFRQQKPKTSKWFWKYAVNVTSTQLTIRNLDNEEYELKVTVTNNEGISSSSKITSATPTPNPGSGSGVAAGVSVSVIVVLALVCVAIFFVVRRRRLQRNKSGADNVPVIFTSGRHQGHSGRAYNQDDGEETAVLETNRSAGGWDSDEVTEQEKSARAEYVNTQQVTRGVAVADIAAYVEGKRCQDGFKNEFQELPSGIRANCTAAKKPQNKNKNRFQDIIAYDHTRVILSVDKEHGDYINANYIMGYNEKKRAYIACQGPRDTTIEDMWRMVWQVKSNTIVMLANLFENDKDKCSQYWPEKNGRRTWGHFTTESVSDEKVADYVVRQFSLKNQETSEVRRIRQLHFTGWPDRGTPQYAYPLLAFRRKMHSFDRATRGPLVVHCSAGVGRTGTFMAIDVLIQQAAVEGTIDVFQCVNLLRTQRMNMVQTLDQYVFVYQAMIESSQATVVPCSTLRQTFTELCRNRQIEQQFERLSAMKPLAKKVKCAALEPNNVSKNRNVDIIPDDQHRPYLVTPWKGSTNFINAIFVHGYKERNAYIITQSPMTSTVVDLWRMLSDHKSRTVVMLDDCDVTDDQCAIYWPTKEGTTQQFGPFQVQLVQTVVSATSNITVREFSLTMSNKETAIVLKQFHLTGVWSQGASLPSNKTVVLELLGLVEKWQQMSGNGPVTVHCSDGASRCGLACAAGYVLEHLKVEQEVDVFHAVQHIRTTRPQLVRDREQYGFLYEIALEYMSLFDEYANFH